MKFCSKPFDFLYIMPEGNVKLCAWSDYILGNILENSIEELWNGEMAERFRESIIDGSFFYCKCESCPYLSMGTLEDMDEEKRRQIYTQSPYPNELSLAYDLTCNHKCPSCRSEMYCASDEQKDILQKITDKVAPYLPKLKKLITNGSGEVFASRYIMKLLESLHPENEDFKLIIETNGGLFNQANWKRIQHLEGYYIKVNVTPNSYREGTYGYLAGGQCAQLEELKDNMQFIAELRDNEKINYLQINFVVQECNYQEVPEFIQISLERYHADEVALKPLNWWFSMTEEVYWFKDILNPLHPYHQDYLRMMKNSWLKHPKVTDWSGGKLHLPRKHPAYRNKMYFELMCKLLEGGEPREKLASYMKNRNIDRIDIYGAGRLGEQVFRLLDNTQVKVEKFIDKFAKGECCGKRINSLYGESHNEVPAIVVTPVHDFKMIKNELIREGYTGKIINFSDVVDS